MKVLIIGRGLIGTYVHSQIPESTLSSSSLAMEYLKDYKYDWVVNCAFDIDQKSTDFSVASSFDAKIINKLGKSRYLMLSSRKVYPKSSQWNASENEEIDFTDIHDSYGKNKYLCERYVKKLIDKNKYLILRLPNIFGQKSSNPVSKTFFNQMLESLKENGVIYFDFNRESKRDFMYAEDLAMIIQTMIEKNISGIYNCGYGKHIECAEVANLLIDYVGYGKIEDEKNLKDEFFLNTAKLNSILPNQRFKGLEIGITEILKNGDFK